MSIDVGITTITCLVLLSICILIRTQLKSIIKSIKENNNEDQTTSTFTTCTECMHEGVHIESDKLVNDFKKVTGFNQAAVCITDNAIANCDNTIGSAAVTTGKYSLAYTNGTSSAAICTGYESAAIADNHDTVALSVGDKSTSKANKRSALAICYGSFSNAVASSPITTAIIAGSYSTAVASCKNSIAISMGYKNKIKGALGSWLIYADINYDDYSEHVNVKSIKIVYVDGFKIKADTYYTVENGKFVEAT